MNDEITIMTIDNKEYVVLEKIVKESHEYLILFEENNPKNIVLCEYFKNSCEIAIIDEEETKIYIFEEFFRRHPELKKENTKN